MHLKHVFNKQAAEDAWNTRNPEKVSLAYTMNTQWRNRHNAIGQWFRSYGNEMWEFDTNGYMDKRYASINDLPIDESERKLR